MKKISVIVPVYNTKEELIPCLKSICSQTYKELEIICVDDGSTDGSGQVVDEFAEKDKRIVVFHQKNGGEGNARNQGLAMATGDYLAFCDCDDWIGQGMYENLARALEKDNLDLAASGWYRVTGPSFLEMKNDLPVNPGVFGRDELLKYLYMRDSYRGFAYMWNKLYRREALEGRKGGRILFDETLKLGGDVVYLADVALRVKRAKYIGKAFYYYNQREESGCHTKDVEKLRDWVRAYEIVLEKFEKEEIGQEIIDYVKRFMAYHCSNAVEIAAAQGNEEAKKDFQQRMQLYEPEYVSLNRRYPARVRRFYQLLKR